ncbi:MAG: serine hydrolase [Gemmataceae bacterium]
MNTPAIDELIDEALQAWEVPGVAVAIVGDNRVLYVKGRGVKDSHTRQAVTPDTIFPLASCTKAFTTTLLAQLVDDGVLDWDDPVRQHLPWFHLADPLADANVTMRDLVTHRTGVASHDFLWYRAPWPPAEVVRKMAWLRPSKSFRSTFIYQSTMFTAAGLALGATTKSSWQAQVQQRLLTPLAMKRTYLTTPEALRAGDHATPHRRDADGQVQAIPWYVIEHPEPAGSLHSCARDMTKWLQLQLGNGRLGDKRLVSAVQLAETRTPQIPLRLTGVHRAFNPDTLQMSYGMGWIIQDYRGQLMVSHAGAIDGFRAHVTLLPQANLGIVLLSNLHQSQMNLALSNTLVDHLLGLPYKDWHTSFRAVERTVQAEADKRKQTLVQARRPDLKPALPLSAYVGSYVEPAYGHGKVTLENDRLVWQWSSFRCPLDHHRQDAFFLSEEHLGDHLISFQIEDGAVKSLTFLDMTFKRPSP